MILCQLLIVSGTWWNELINCTHAFINKLMDEWVKITLQCPYLLLKEREQRKVMIYLKGGVTCDCKQAIAERKLES